MDADLQAVDPAAPDDRENTRSLVPKLDHKADSDSLEGERRPAVAGMSAAPPPTAARRRKGGPRTDAGKEKSRANSLRHGLTATTLIHAVLPAGRVDELRAELAAEIAPRTILERFLVDEVARHAAMLELGERAELAVLRRSAAGLAPLGGAPAELEDSDAVLAAAATSDAVDKFSRYRRGHEKAAYAAIKVLRELRSAGGATPVSSVASQPSTPTACWRTEEDCEAWLAQRVAGGDWRCPVCGHPRANYLRARRAVQCQACRRQFGLRAGTVMARSPVPLTVWFTAILMVLEEPAIAAAELARRTGIERPATAQTILNRIRAARTSDDADRSLAGLVAAMRV